MTELSDRKMIVAALVRIDSQIIVTDFIQDWEYAIQSAHRTTGLWAKTTATLRRALNVLVKYRTVTGMAAIFFIGSLVVLTRTAEIKVPVVDLDTENRPARVILDPNMPWYAPTDDLLLVNVLQFEQQWPSHAIYDPLTMEIR